MANRLTKITTRTGDDGTTGLGDGARTRKSSPRIVAMGEIDELNSVLGMVVAERPGDEVAGVLQDIQHDLFDLGGELSIPGFERLGARRLALLDGWITRYNADLPVLAEFILPGGCRAAALAHLARSTCRRAERSVVALAALEFVTPLAQQYLNRLSDLLFVLARVMNRDAGVPDVLWQRDRPQA
jgi:cob(I)alamin adenosyltransferase